MAAKLVWDNAPNGVVSVSADGVNWVTPILTGRFAVQMDSVIRQWGDAAARECATQKGLNGQPLPVAWALAHIKVESDGDPFARNPDGGVGLMQITSPDLKGPHSDNELMADPLLNLHIGCTYLASLWADRGIDLVATTSMWNGGRDRVTRRPHPMDASPYGFRETIMPPAARSDPAVPITYDHITAIIRANNYYLLKGSGVGTGMDIANLTRRGGSSSPAMPGAKSNDAIALGLGLLLLGSAVT